MNLQVAQVVDVLAVDAENVEVARVDRLQHPAHVVSFGEGCERILINNIFIYTLKSKVVVLCSEVFTIQYFIKHNMQHRY